MKKLIVALLLIALMVPVFTLPASAAQITTPDPLAVEFKDELELLERGYSFGHKYMAAIANVYFGEKYGYEKAVSAAEYEAYLNSRFVVDSAALEKIRTDCEPMLIYNATANTYTPNGTYFTSLDPWNGNYLGYVKTGNQYLVYFQNLEIVWLNWPDNGEEWDVDKWIQFRDEHYDPTTGLLTYKGISYQQSMDGWYASKGSDTGRKYTLEINDNGVRIVSIENYAAGQAPTRFDDKPITYDLSASGVTLPEESTCFPGGTTVKVTEIKSGNVFTTVKNAMKTVAEKYAAYEFTATKDNVAVQPNGKFEVTFNIPQSFSNDLSVYYMAADGKLEKLNAKVYSDSGVVVAELTHFSTYILVDNATKPAVTPPVTTDPTTPTPTTPAPTTPAPTTPAPTTPAPTTPAPTTPAPGATEPDATEPDTTEPVTTTPDTDEPNTTVPATSAPTSNEPNDTTLDENNGGGKTGIIIAVIVVALLAAGAGVFLFLRKKGKI